MGVLWWFTELRASASYGGRKAIAGRIKPDESQKRNHSTRVAGDWWEPCIEDGHRVVKRWRSGATEAVKITMKKPNEWEHALSSVPSFGNKDYLYFVDGQKVTVCSNKDVLSLEDHWEFNLNELICSKNKRNGLLFGQELNMPDSYYKSCFHLSKHHLLARYVEFKPFDECIHKIEDIVFCFKVTGSTFKLKSKHSELVEWDQYYSHHRGKDAEFNFFSHLEVDYVLTYSVSKPLFSLSFFTSQSLRMRKLLRWGNHLRVKREIEGFSMDYDEDTKVLAAATFYRPGFNKFLAIPMAKLYRIKLN